MVLITNYVFIFYCLLQGVMAIEIFNIKLALLTTFMFRFYRPLILNSFAILRAFLLVLYKRYLAN